MELKKLIANETAAIDRCMREDLAGFEASLDPLLLEILEYSLFSGGKRVRPLLAVISGRLFGCDKPSLYELALGFEYLHVATLCHDDVIDQADSRRGRMSVVRRYGMTGAILAGDFLHAHALDIVGRVGGNESLTVLSRATRGMVDGEFIQLRNSTNLNQSVADYFAVITGKTALLISSACEIGAIFGGAGERERNALKTYGHNLGLAFQIVDDLLDYQGVSDKTGKSVGNDLVEGKITLPLIIALQRAAPAEKDRLLDILKGDERAGRLDEVRTLIDRNEGFSGAKEQAETLIQEAREALSVVVNELNSASGTLLNDLASYVLSRDS